MILLEQRSKYLLTGRHEGTKRKMPIVEPCYFVSLWLCVKK